MSGRPVTYYEPDETGCMAVLCWCEAEIVHVPAVEVRVCRTLSCGRNGCEEP